MILVEVAMRKVLFTVFALCFAVTCDAMSKDYLLQADHSGSGRICIVSATTEEPMSLHDVLHIHSLEGRDIPSSEEECEVYFQQYQKGNSDALKYTSNFWMPVARTSVEIMFCCLDSGMIGGFEKKVRPFLEFVQSRGSLFFKIDIVDKYFSKWRDVLLDLEGKASEHEGTFYFKEVRGVLNSLLLIVDAEKSIIEWSF